MNLVWDSLVKKLKTIT